MIIEEASIIINKTVIETIDSHTISIFNNQNLNTKGDPLYNRSTCNLKKYFDPTENEKYP